MDRPKESHPAKDVLARIMDLIGLSFGLGCLWLAVSAVRV